MSLIHGVCDRSGMSRVFSGAYLSRTAVVVVLKVSIEIGDVADRSDREDERLFLKLSMLMFLVFLEVTDFRGRIGLAVEKSKEVMKWSDKQMSWTMRSERRWLSSVLVMTRSSVC